MKYFLETPADIEIKNAILKELISQLDITLRRAQGSAENAVRQLTRELISNTDFINELTNFLGDLRGEFGLRLGSAPKQAQTIVHNIAEDTYLFYNPLTMFGNQINGGWTLAMGRNLFQILKDIPDGKTFTQKGQIVPWLKWTLERGNAVIIGDFGVRFRLGAGRSGLAVMVPDLVVGWRIPPKYAGTDHDNWITRKILANVNKYEDILSKQIMANTP